jgi:hypothetical protein
MFTTSDIMKNISASACHLKSTWSQTRTVNKKNGSPDGKPCEGGIEPPSDDSLLPSAPIAYRDREDVDAPPYSL